MSEDTSIRGCRLGYLAFTIDPLEKFTQYSSVDLVESLGILPIWLVNGDKDTPAKQVFKDSYDFWVSDRSIPGVIRGDGVMMYDGDPDMYPIAMCDRDEETIYFYQNAMVGIVNQDGTFITRMD